MGEALCRWITSQSPEIPKILQSRDYRKRASSMSLDGTLLTSDAAWAEIVRGPESRGRAPRKNLSKRTGASQRLGLAISSSGAKPTGDSIAHNRPCLRFIGEINNVYRQCHGGLECRLSYILTTIEKHRDSLESAFSHVPWSCGMARRRR